MAFLAHSQNYIPKVTTYTTEDGLSSNEIYAIHKDARGFMWIGTHYGLNRFDGQEFKVYTRENTPELDFNVINNILEDDKGNLWLVKNQDKYQYAYTAIAINIFNIYSGSIHTLEAHFGNDLPFEIADLTFVKQLSNGTIFIHCRATKKAFLYRSDSGFQPIRFPTEVQQISNISLQEDHFLVYTLIPGTNYNILKINFAGEILKKGFCGFKWGLKNHQKSIQLETWGGCNLIAFQYLSPDWDKLFFNLRPRDNSIYQTEFNPAQDLFWLKRKDRFSVVNRKEQIVYEYPIIEGDFGKIPFFFDENTTWFSDKKTGLTAVTLELNHFQVHQFFEKPIENSMRGILKDQNNTLWFSSTHGFGKKDKHQQVKIMDKEGFSRLLEDRQGNIWGFHQGQLACFDIKKNQETYFPVKCYNYIWSLFEADNNEIWLGAGIDNFYALDPITGAVKSKGLFPKLNKEGLFNIYDFQKRDAESVWVCTNQGLFIIDWEGNILATYNEVQSDEFYFPANDFRHLYQNGNEIWVATGDAGLFQLNQQKGGLKIKNQFTTSNGLSSNSIHAIYADSYDYLWISSDHGLMQLDRRNKQIAKYFEADGILQNEFNRIAHFHGKDGQLYFGGIHGITSFDPKNFSNCRDKVQAPKLEIADYQQFSGEQESFQNLTANLLQKNKITLQANDRFFKLKLGLLDFKHGRNSVYRYRIKGLYDWQSTQNKELSISGLPYGNHVLDVKAQNANRQDSANTLSIDIQVLRPFYLQWWFIALSIGLLGLGVFIFFKRRTRSLLLKQEAHQLKSLDQMKSRFFANISHELRTPLTLIGLPLEQLMKNYDQFSKKEAMQYLQAAYSNKENINHLVNEILDLSKLEEGKLKLDYQVLTLRSFLERVIGVFRSAALAKNVQYRFSCFVNDTLVAKMDAGKLEMVINNLLSNALKFTPENGSITIHTEWDEQKGLLFKVQDSGKGIHKNDLPHVFERYFQSNQENTKMEGSSGIGLAICKEFIDLMGGSIRVESASGKGSIFSFTLPLEKSFLEPEILSASTIEKEQSPLKDLATTSTFSKAKQTILIVEDHPELQQHLQNILTPQYNTLTASNGFEALNILSPHPSSLTSHSSSLTSDLLTPDLLLSDVMMPEMDGFTFLEKIKQSKDWCHLPFILLTARADMRDKLQGLTLGVDDYLTKPFEVEELLLRIKNLLANVKNRTIEVPLVETKLPKAPEEKKATNFTPRDLEWIKEVEAIAYREIKNNQFNFEDLARELHISKRQMARRVKQITGFTPIQYFREIKLQKARTLLETQQVSTLKEVTYAIGFENTFYFSKLFYERFGKRPESFFQHSH